MDVIVSRRLKLPRTPLDLKDEFYFNLWQKRHWPYEALKTGDTIFLYESLSRRFIWKTRAVDVRTTEYQSRQEAFQWLQSHYGDFDAGQPYLEGTPEEGYGLAFKCEPIAFLDKPIPKGLRIPMLGWEKDAEFIKASGLS